MSRFLRHIYMESFGAARDFNLGPLGPGLNVVFGPNEAGKSTVASFIDGVLFGWDKAHGVRNTYLPVDGERAGSREFGNRGVDGSVGQSVIVSRRRDEAGLQGDASVIADINSATYRTMFWLTSDELRSLRNTSDVTARLLAAGSATGSSPSSAYVEVEQRIAALTAPAGDGSIQALKCELDVRAAQIASASENLALLKQQDRERRELVEARAAARARLDGENAQIESLRIAYARLDALDAQVKAHEAELDALEVERVQADAEMAAKRETGDAGERLVMLDATAERSLRDAIDELADEQARAARAVDIARENSAASSATYEALVEIGDGPDDASKSGAARGLRRVAAFLLPLVFIVASVPVFMYGRETRSLSFTVFGIALLVFAGLLAVGALAVILRPDKHTELLEGRRKDAQWVMVQDQKKLDASMRVKEDVDRRITAFLADSGLGAAEGSVRRARALLDDAQAARSQLNMASQRLSSLELRIQNEAAALDGLHQDRADVLAGCELSYDASLRDVDEHIRNAVAQRDALSMSLDDMNQRFMALDKRLDQALVDCSLDELKLAFHQTSCQLRERKHELVILLLAKRLLEKSIVAWESRSQPEVYAQASRIFSELTNGAWRSVDMAGDGSLIATDAVGAQRDVRHLSLGTCQQLYLALRVAMLLQATMVGRDIPIIADDILVHFDADRRACAARVLAELASKRQVIVFTCHRETVHALRLADSSLTYLEL